MNAPAFLLLLILAQEIPDDLKFGFEPTAMSRKMVDRYDPKSKSTAFDEERQARRKAMIEALREELPGSEFTETKFLRPVRGIVFEGKEFLVEVDDGVLEISPPPQTLSTIHREIGAVFRAFDRAGVKPEFFWGGRGGGGGHIHIDATPFRKNPLLLRNLLVDVYNRPYLSTILHELGDTDTAKPLRHAETQFLRFVNDLDAEKRYTFDNLFGRWRHWMNGDRDFEVNLIKKAQPWFPPKTVEFRAIRAQNTVQDAYDLALLLHRYLKKLNRARRPIEPVRYSAEELDLLRTPTVAAEKWREFVRDLGLDPERYERFVRTKFPPPVTSGGIEARLMQLHVDEESEVKLLEYELKATDPKIKRVFVNGREVDLHGRGLGSFRIPYAGEGSHYIGLRALDEKGKAIQARWDLSPEGDPFVIRERIQYLPPLRSTIGGVLELEAIPAGRSYVRLRIRNLRPDTIRGVRVGDRVVAFSKSGDASIPLNKGMTGKGILEIEMLDGKGAVADSARMDLVRGGVEGRGRLPTEATVRSLFSRSGRGLLEETIRRVLERIGARPERNGLLRKLRSLETKGRPR